MLSREGLHGFITSLSGSVPSESDSNLLDRFVRGRDEAAFTGIVRRHGLMVLSVCQRRLRREADVEDAFQAVFLALARSARSIVQRESLPGWLYRAAYLIALKAAGVRARRSTGSLPDRELSMSAAPASSPENEEAKSVLDEELAALSSKFRAAVVLCLVEGHTNSEAAAVLGVPVGTVDSRLSAARK